MLQQQVQSLGNPGTFDITDKTDPLYYIARFSHEMSMNFYQLNSQSFEFRQMEDTDFSSMEDEVDTYFALVKSWISNAVNASDAGNPIPSAPSFPMLTDTVEFLQGGSWQGFLFRLFVQVGIAWLEKKLSSSTDAGELAQILRKAMLKGEDEDEYAILEQLSNTPLEIIISKEGDYQDICYSDRPET
jgi:hypothetical protein